MQIVYETTNELNFYEATGPVALPAGCSAYGSNIWQLMKDWMIPSLPANPTETEKEAALKTYMGTAISKTVVDETALPTTIASSTVILTVLAVSANGAALQSLDMDANSKLALPANSAVFTETAWQTICDTVAPGQVIDAQETAIISYLATQLGVAVTDEREAVAIDE